LVFTAGLCFPSVFISSCNGAISICGSRCPIAAILLCPLYFLSMYYVVDGCIMNARYLFDIPAVWGDGGGRRGRERGGGRIVEGRRWLTGQ